MSAGLDDCERKFGAATKIMDHPIIGPLAAGQWRKFHWCMAHHARQLRERMGKVNPGWQADPQVYGKSLGLGRARPAQAGQSPASTRSAYLLSGLLLSFSWSFSVSPLAGLFLHFREFLAGASRASVFRQRRSCTARRPYPTGQRCAGGCRVAYMRPRAGGIPAARIEFVVQRLDLLSLLVELVLPLVAAFW